MSDTDKLLKDAWLNIDVDENQLFNPLDYIYDMCGEDKTQIINNLAWLMTRPEYFSFVCKYIFNIEICLEPDFILQLVNFLR